MIRAQSTGQSIRHMFRRRWLISLAGAAIALSSCSAPIVESDSLKPVDGVVFTEAPAPPAPKVNDDCRGYDARASYAPNAGATGPTLDKIRARGKLIVGTSADTLLFAARNPFTGKIEGYDIDILRELAARIFPGRNPDQTLQIRVITFAQRIPLLESGEVDAVAHTMTINCTRWNRIAFSSEYYTAGQQLLGKSAETAKSIEDMPKGSRICVPAGGTSEENLASYAANEFVPVPVADITDCLVKMQQGGADAVLSDNTVAEGFIKQDPNLKLIGPFISSEPYGIGFNAAAVELVQIANAMLDEIRANGKMVELLQRNSLKADVIPIADHTRMLS